MIRPIDEDIQIKLHKITDKSNNFETNEIASTSIGRTLTQNHFRWPKALQFYERIYVK